MTDTSSQHSLLTKSKHFREPNKKDLRSNSSKLLGATNDSVIEDNGETIVIQEENDGDTLNLSDIPDAEFEDDVEETTDALFVTDDEPHPSKRTRAMTSELSDSGQGSIPLAKRTKLQVGSVSDDQADDKKKMAMDTSYDGFSIYGRVLCLIVKRKDNKSKTLDRAGVQAMMEDWIVSTQMPAQEDA